MKRTRQEKSSKNNNKKARLDDVCAICRNAIGDKCIACEVFRPGEPCQGFVPSAVCGHVFHMECISRWLDLRRCCPLCNATWVYPTGLALDQLAAAKFVDKEIALLQLATQGDLAPRVYDVLDHGPNTSTPPGNTGENALAPGARKLLARTFAHYLSEAELQTVLASKRAPTQVEKL